MNPIRVAIIDDHPVVTRGLSLHMESIDKPIDIVATAETVADFLASRATADVILLDLQLADGSSIPSIPTLIGTGANVLIYTSEQRPVPLRRAVRAGASGVLLKTDGIDVVAEAVMSSLSGEFCVSGPLANALLHDPSLVTELTEMQVKVLQRIDDGLDIRAVAKALDISTHTVKEYLSRIRKRYTARGIDPGNSHRLTRLSYDEGHLR